MPVCLARGVCSDSFGPPFVTLCYAALLSDKNDGRTDDCDCGRTHGGIDSLFTISINEEAALHRRDAAPRPRRQRRRRSLKGKQIERDRGSEGPEHS